jgi:hypothetical protein
MAVKTEYQAVVSCDFCSDNIVEGYWRQKETIKEARRLGWKIGKKVTCPKCQVQAHILCSERIKAGMNRARMLGKRIGRPKIVATT